MTPLVPASFSEIRANFAAAGKPAKSWNTVVEAFRWVDVEIQPDLAPGFAGSMPFLIAMRGALGRVLSDADVTPAQESHADQPSAFRLMFHSMGEMAKGLDYP